MRKLLLLSIVLLSGLAWGQGIYSPGGGSEQAQIYGLNGITAVKGLTTTPIAMTTLASGDNSLFTAPASSYCLISGTWHNSSAGSLNLYPEISYDAGATWRRTANLAAVAQNAQSAAGALASNVALLSAAEVFGVNASGTGVNFVGMAQCWSSASKLKKVSKNGSWSAGNNTVYTCPAGPCYVVTVPQNSANAGLMQLMNETGGALNYVVNIVPSGGSVATANRIFAPTAATANITLTNVLMGGAMATNDFVSVNTSSTSASQTFWFLVCETCGP